MCIRDRKGIVREGVLSINHAWDFFSEKDGEVHHMDICEAVSYTHLVWDWLLASL